MLKALSFRNAKRQAKDYLIYFITLILSVSLMFGLNSMIFSKDIFTAIGSAKSMRYTIIITSVIIVLILAWLTSYMMDFILKKRSKELSIYMILGIENKEIKRMFIRENFIIGIFSLFIGFLGGIFVFQVLKSIVMNLIGFEYKLTFEFSLGAIGLTLLYYNFIYFIAIVRSSKIIQHKKLYDLLNYNRQNEKIEISDNWKRFAILSISLLFLIAAMYFFIETPLGEGVDYPIGILFLTVYIYCFFISLPNIVIRILNSSNWKYKGCRAILFRNFTSKINSISKTMGFTSIIFTISLFLISIGMIQIATFNHRVDIVPFDFSIISEEGPETIKKYKDFANKNLDIVNEYTYNIYQSNINEYKSFKMSFNGYNYTPAFTSQFDLCMKYSDYLELRKMLGYVPVSLNDDEFLIHCLSYALPDLKRVTENNPIININEHKIKLSGILSENLDQYDGFSNGNFWIFIVPDKVTYNMKILFSKYSVITNNSFTSTQYNEILDNFTTLKPFRFALDNGEPQAQEAVKTEYIDAKTAIRKANGVMYSTGALPMWYVAFILCITGITILASNILSDESKYKRQFELLKKIGYSERMIDKMILNQLKMFFIVPAIFSLILNCILCPIFVKDFGADVFVPTFELWYNIFLAYAIYIAVYLIYYIASYILLRGYVSKNNS